jgi:hypothetical protein
VFDKPSIAAANYKAVVELFPPPGPGADAEEEVCLRASDRSGEGEECRTDG